MTSDGPTRKRLAAVLRQARVESGLTQEQLADSAAVHRTYISQLERGIKSPTVEVLQRISQALGQKTSTILARLEEAVE